MGWNDHVVEFSILLGETLKSVEGVVGSDEIEFITESGKTFRMLHNQNCCESVSVESIVGDWQDLIGNPILLAEESSSNTHPEGHEASKWEESFTWTFYKLATIKGYVDIRWYGSSNGYYSESVNFELIEGAA